MSESRPMQRGGDGGRERARRRDGGQSKVSLRASQPRPMTRSSQGDLKDISRLREVIGQLPTEGRTFDKEEELRWRINQLEKDKLELNSKYNQEVSGFEAQLTRCRALLEKGEAQRQTLEYELAVVKRDAAAQNSRSEDKIADLIKHNQQLEGLSAELRQRGSDLQKALEITQQARYDDERSLQVELRERDHLIHSISTERELLQEENTRLHTLLQEHKDTLQKLKDRMEGIQRDRERDTEELKMKTCELRKSMEREEELRTEVETVNKRVKALEKCVESERAAHMEFKVNAEVIQIRLRDMEAAQSVEKRNQAEVVSSLELLKHKFGEVERAHTQERERADNTQHTLTRVELEYQNTKANLIGQLEREKAVSSDRIGQLEKEKAESAKLIGQLEKEKVESAKLIGQLKREKAESAKLIGQLEREKAESAKLIGQLEKEKAESAKLIGQLEREKAESAKLIGQLEREKAESAKRIGQLEREKAESVKLIGQLEKEKAESAKLSVRLQEQKRVQMEREHELNLVQERLVFLEETYHGLLKELEQLLHHHHHQGASPISCTGDQRNHSTLMDILKRVLHRYHTELKDLVKVIDALNKENKDKEEIITDQRRRIQECEAQCVCVSEEAERLRVYAAESADAAERMQRELESITHRWGEERERHTQTKTHTHTLTQEHKKEHQEKLAFLHSLYQRLLTGGVLVASPQSMMGSFSWAELSIMLQEQADVLTSDLHSANQRITFLESVCEGKEAALTSVCEQLKQREETWIKQREELDTQHTHLINELHTRAQDLQSRLDHTVKCLHGSERAHSILQQEVSRLQELVRVCRRDNASLLAACALLAGCVSSLRGRVCALLQQKAVLKRGVCDAQSLRQEVGALLRALADPGVQGQSKVTRGVWRFRVHVIGVMAALRLRTLCRNTHTLLRAAGGVCVSELRLSNTHTQEEEENQRVMKMLTSSQLCVILHSCMQELQTELQRTTESSVCVAAAARSSFTKLMEKVLPESEWGCYGDMGLLARQLGHGLNNLRKMHHVPLRHDSNKIMVSALQQHFLEFTQRLHTAEVERRDLRIKLSHIKRRNTHTEMKDSTHTASVSLAQFRGVCEELSSALRREQQAQTLLHEQATQLQELGITMETHTSEQLEKDHTLAQAVQSLADAKVELKKKDQTLRLLGKQLNQSQQEKQELQQVTKRAENTLYMAARSKECVLSYLVSVERRMKELKDQLLLSHSTFSRDDLTLHLPTMHQDLQLDGGGAEMKACQALVCSFTDVYELVCSKMECLEREISSYQSHISAQKAELHHLIRPTETPAPLSESEGNQEMPALTHTGVTDVPRSAHTLQKKSTVPLKKSRGVKKSTKTSTKVKYASKSSTEKP
ncbi:coiled-coil domain-containing protein 171 isoform X1 [Silurus meridionalis]|uniref:coiled-coil domain-containing protein 171 isoform X1 n=1 Tax=Silurus meridionalis TaxID=175797 RepID=UPI001EEC967F|nr:coiled-coil domain-containing protein 171 isoform X1 [Silurus meridionalis]XP_046724965.1 coiled-coil domain-containing protein 171 isoform X1 [Silurus meridionalis]